jgi:two-component system response regulator HydG
MNGTLLIVDDDLDAAHLLHEILRKRGFTVDVVHSAADCLDWLVSHRADVVIADVQMVGMDGIELCQELRRYPDMLTIVVTAQVGLETAVAAIRAGAYDFVTKPVKIDALSVAVGRAMQHLSLKREVMRLRTTREVIVDGIAGNSPAIRDTVTMIHRVAESDATVLITGESGTGKELVARALHNLSPRRDKPFVAVNCAAMPAPLLESELFGHVRGAFTDAKQSRPGLFAQAGHGTIFLDEIGEMPIEMQVKLLRVLQERKVRPVGGDEEVAFCARVVTATNRNLEREIEEKRFREDLYYRVNVVAIPVPPLRARGGDILLLAQYFLERSAAQCKKPVKGISSTAAKMLMDYEWPGNVRELENCMERAVALCRLDEITIEDLPAKLHEQTTAQIVIMTDAPNELLSLDAMERRYVRKVLDAVGGNKTHAARVLGIDRRSLYRRLEHADPAAQDPAASHEAAAEPTERAPAA